MQRGRRAMVAAVATAAAVLAFGQPSRGVRGPVAGAHAVLAAAPATDFPPSTGSTVATSVMPDGSTANGGGAEPLISGDGRSQVFTASDDLDPDAVAAVSGVSRVFVRNLRDGVTHQISIGNTTTPTQNPTTPDGAVAIDGGSFQPSISADGRFVSFLTRATNLVQTTGGTPGNQPTTLVVCDRDPTGAQDSSFQPILDQPLPGHTVPNYKCLSVYSSATSSTDAIASNERPRLSANGTKLAWVRGVTVGSVTQDMVRTSSVSDFTGLTVPASSLGDPVPLTGFTVAEEHDPVFDQFGSAIAFAATTTAGVGAVFWVDLNDPTHPKRVDLVPGHSTFLGDQVAPAAGKAFFSSIAMSNEGDRVSFVGSFPTVPPPGSDDFAYVVENIFSASPTSLLYSRDNTGAAVNDVQGAGLSPDGRYAAFTTAKPNAHDGKDVTSGGGNYLVVRDLQLDAARAAMVPPLDRVAGALGTPIGDGTTPCAPTPPQIYCASAQAAVTEISFDEFGSQVSFQATPNDLVPNDNNNQFETADTFVRSWQPTFDTTATPAGPVQVGANRVINVPVKVTNFGPVLPTDVGLGSGAASQFTIVGNSCTGGGPIHFGETCDIAVRFAPDSTGTKTATLTLTAAQYGGSPVPAGAVTGSGVVTGPKNAPADNTRTSVDPTGAQAPSGGDQSMVSGDGQWDVFVSRDNLTNRPISPDSGKTGVSNIFVRDLANPQDTVQISLHAVVPTSPGQPSRPAVVPGGPTGASPNDDSYSPSISSDGRFVSFLTAAGDVVPLAPGGNNDPATKLSTIVVCDRDPSGAKDSAGHLLLDQPRPGTKVPDYVCYPVESGAGNDGGLDADLGVRPMLAGNGTRITWVETSDNTDHRVLVSTLSTPGGALHAPSASAYVPSGVTGFEHVASRSETSIAQQTEPVLTADGNKVVYEAEVNGEGPNAFAVIEADLATATDERVDSLDGTTFLGDNGAPSLEIQDQPATSGDGNRIAFSYIDPKTTAGVPLVYVVTRTSGKATGFTGEVVSKDNSGTNQEATAPALSGDGRYVAFRAEAPDMTNGVDPPNGSCSNQFEQNLHVVCQIVARDLVRDAQRATAGQPRLPNELVSTSTKVCAPGRLCGGDRDADNPSIDATGSEIGFDTAANDIVPGDTNDDVTSTYCSPSSPCPTTDSFVHTWRPELVPLTFDFGAVAVGAHKDKTFTVTVRDFGATPQDFGPISLGASSITGLDPADFQILSTTCTGTTLHQGAPAGQPLAAAPESCTFKIRFAPTTLGNRKATLMTAYARNSFPRALTDPALVRDLTGVGAGPIAVVNPTILDFGKRLPDAPKVTKTVTVTNTGSAPLIITAVTVNDTTHPGAKIDYTVDATDCLGATPVGGTCVIKVSFVGHKVGIRDAVLVLVDNTPTGTTAVGLKGRVGKPTISANPGVSPVGRVITISGTGFAPSQDVDLGFGTDVQVTGKTRADGTFDIQLVVLANGPQGPRTLHGHSTGLDNTIAADTPFLTVLGSIDNTLNGIRH